MTSLWFVAPDLTVARDLLAREMWMRENDSDGTEWDRDELLTDTYEEFEGRATDAIVAASNTAGRVPELGRADVSLSEDDSYGDGICRYDPPQSNA